MAKDCHELLQKAQRAPHNLPFKDLCDLARCWGFERKRQSGSHIIFKQEEFSGLPKEHAMQNFQERDGQAVKYQVDQLIDAIHYIADNYEI